MAVVHEPLKATESYSAAFRRVCDLRGKDWIATDWDDCDLQWRFLSPAGVTCPDQGWKVHVSASAVESAQALSTIATELCRLGVPFKVPRRIEDIVRINSGDVGAELLGKVITAYPHGDRETRLVIERCDQLWPESRGPEVQTDLHVRPRSAVSFRYGVFRISDVVVSSSGMYSAALTSSEGSKEPDDRLLDGTQFAKAPPSPVEGCAPTVWPVYVNDAYRVGDREYLVLAVLGQTARARTYLAADIDTLDTAVLKIGRRGVAGDLRGHDVADMLASEFSVLRAVETIHDLAPGAIQWSDGEWPTLVMRDFRGDVLAGLPRRERIASLPLLADAVARLHEAGFVHGDIKLENAILRNDRVGLIDFETAAEIGKPMRSGGTPGHRAPEIDGGTYVAAQSRDVFALAGCVIEAVLGIPPALVGTNPDRLRGQFGNEGFIELMDVIAPWLDAEPSVRPTAREAASVLHRKVTSICNAAPRDHLRDTSSTNQWCRRASYEASLHVHSFATADEKGMRWRNAHFMRAFECEGINIGAAGILLGLATIDQALSRDDHAEEIDQGASWLAARPANGNAAGLYTGNAGVALALAVAGSRLNDNSYLAAAERRFKVATTDHREIDFFSGIAGVAYTATILARILKDEWPIAMAKENARLLLKCAMANRYASNGSGKGKDELNYFGCAHGIAGIALSLAQWGHATGERGCRAAARALFRQVARDGFTGDGMRLRIGPRDARRHAAGNWCHGVAGYLWAMVLAFGDDRELGGCIDRAAGAFSGAMSVGTPTYCHGLAGQLELWRMLERIPRYRHRARSQAAKVVRALRIQHTRVDGLSVWTSDDPDIVTPDLWIGFLGPATALAMHASGVPHPLLTAEWLSVCSTGAGVEQQAGVG